MTATKSRRVRLTTVIALLLVTAPTVATRAAVTQLGPLPYLSAADSPLLADPSLVTTIEDFEDGALNVPGIVNSPTPPSSPPSSDGIGVVVGPGSDTDSVDADDGVVDGSGTAGHSYRSTRIQPLITFPTKYEFAIQFELLRDSHGNYPTAFGFVWIDSQPGSHVAFGGRELNANRTFFFEPLQSLGDMAFSGETAEDRFFGVKSTIGLTFFSIVSSYFDNEGLSGLGLKYFEMDHLQIAYPKVPEPAGIVQAALLAVATLYAAYRSGAMAIVALLLVTTPGVAARAAVTQLGPLPYLSAADSPLLADPSLVTTIEDFEDGLLNVPGIVNSPITPLSDGIGIVFGPGPDTDSVDADDGSIDGSGTAGHSFRSTRFGGLLVFPEIYESDILFTFLPDNRGNYPTAFGFVWTDGQPDSRVEFGGRDVNGSSFSFGHFSLGTAQPVGDLAFTGATAEDRFFGVKSTIGLTFFSIGSYFYADSVTTGPPLEYFEMDHLQIGYPIVPEPAGIVQAALLVAATLYRIYRRHGGARARRSNRSQAFVLSASRKDTPRT